MELGGFVDRIAELRKLAELRLQQPRDIAASADATVKFDEALTVILKEAHDISDSVQAVVDRDRVSSARLQLVVLIVLLVLFAGIILLVLQKRQADRVRQAELEQNVADRTLQLSDANEQLARATWLLREANTKLSSAARHKDEFLASMSHELRTPLNAILGFTELMLEGVQGPVNEKQAKSLQAVDESGRHLLALINDILDLSKIEAGQEKLAIESTVIAEVCEGSLRFVRQTASKKKINISTRIDPALDALPADERRLRQILINLLGNAVKFTPDGGRVGLEVAHDADGMVRFTVWDTGIGISDEDQAKLFKSFVQIDSKLTRQYGGTGLGLALVKRLTEMHGGRVALESEPDKGSRFSVFLPLKQSPPAESGASELIGVDGLNYPELRLRNPLVLVVEDRPVMQAMVSEFLSALGCRMIFAGDGEAALTEAARSRPAIVLMDVKLPGSIDGLETTRRLKGSLATTGIPVFALTAQAMSGDREKCLAAGADEYLSKPVNLKELAGLIERYVVRSGNAP